MNGIDASNANNWQQVWSLNGIPLSDPGKRYTRVTCPILLSSPVIALMFSIPFSVDDRLQFGGWVNRYIQTGLIVGGQPDARLEGARKLWANKLQIITFSIKTSYSLTFDAAITGDACNLFAWEYTGLIT